MKRILSVLLILCLCLLSSSPCAYARGQAAPAQAPTENRTVALNGMPDVARFIQAPEPDGELHIAPAVLQTADGEADVYFVAICGIDWFMRGVNNFFAYLLVSFNYGNRYQALVRDAILRYVPEGAKLVLAGHSLGGMIAQQLICAEELTSRYEILNTLTLGSPYVVVDTAQREGDLVRLEDRYDTVPRASIAAFVSPANYNGAIKEDSPYAGDPNGAHNHSYMRGDIWGAYDVLGEKDGGARLFLDSAAMVTIQA